MIPYSQKTSHAVAAIFYAVMLLLTACTGTPRNNLTGNLLIPASADKQVLRIPVEGGDFDTLDPALTTAGGDPINILFTGLVTPTADGTIIDQLAASHQISANGLTYTFTLKSGLKFSDGTPLGADDVAYSINRAILPATKSNERDYLRLLKDFDRMVAGNIPTLIGDSLIVQNPTTISIIISKPAAYFLQALSYPTSYTVERKLILKYGNQWTDHLEEGGGAGPFKVASYLHSRGLDLVPDSNYYGVHPQLRQIKYILASDRDSNYRAYEAGQYDLAAVPPAEEESARNQPGFHNVPALASRYIGLNYLVKPLNTLKIRQALALAINKDLIVKRIIGSLVTPSNHIVPQGMPGYNANLLGPAGIASTAGNPDKARQLLREGLHEAGYRSVDQLPPLSLSYSTDYKAGANTMLAVADEWKQVLGITVNLIGLSGTELIRQTDNTVGHAGPLQIWYSTWGTDYPDPQDWLSIFFGKGSEHNAFNYGQNNSTSAIQQQTVQAELEKADGERDFTKRKLLYNDAEQKIVNDAGWITTYQSSYVGTVNPKLQNWQVTPLAILPPDSWGKIYFTQ